MTSRYLSMPVRTLREACRDMDHAAMKRRVGAPLPDTTEVKMNGSDCVTVLGARWLSLSSASDPKILAQVECWPAVPTP